MPNWNDWFEDDDKWDSWFDEEDDKPVSPVLSAIKNNTGSGLLAIDADPDYDEPYTAIESLVSWSPSNWSAKMAEATGLIPTDFTKWMVSRGMDNVAGMVYGMPSLLDRGVGVVPGPVGATARLITGAAQEVEQPAVWDEVRTEMLERQERLLEDVAEQDTPLTGPAVVGGGLVADIGTPMALGMGVGASDLFSSIKSPLLRYIAKAAAASAESASMAAASTIGTGQELEAMETSALLGGGAALGGSIAAGRSKMSTRIPESALESPTRPDPLLEAMQVWESSKVDPSGRSSILRAEADKLTQAKLQAEIDRAASGMGDQVNLAEIEIEGPPTISQVEGEFPLLPGASFKEAYGMTLTEPLAAEKLFASHAGQAGFSEEAVRRGEAGNRFWKINQAGNVMPIIGVDSVDVKPGKGEVTFMTDASGNKTVTGGIPSRIQAKAMERLNAESVPSNTTLAPEMAIDLDSAIDVEVFKQLGMDPDQYSKMLVEVKPGGQIAKEAAMISTMSKAGNEAHDPRARAKGILAGVVEIKPRRRTMFAQNPCVK